MAVNFFKNLWVKIVENKWHILILLLIFLIALGFRLHIMRYDGFIEPDAYWHARANAAFIQEPFENHIDLLSTYHKADKAPYQTSLLWYFGVLFWNIFTLGAAYSKDIWVWFIRLLPAFYGAFTALAMYFLFRVGYKNRIVGYLAAFFAAVMPAFVYRTMSGHYEEDCMGFLWMVLGFGFLVLGISKFVETKSVKWKPIVYGLLGGLFLGIMALVWSVFAFVPVVLIGYFITILIMKLVVYKDHEFLKGFSIVFCSCFILMGAIATAWSTNWIKVDVNYVSGILGLNDTSVNTQEMGSVSSMKVGEESQGYPAFGSKYNIFLIFIITGLILGLYRIIFNKKDWFTLLILVWAVGCLYLAWNKLKATFWFGLPLAALTVLTMYELYHLFIGTNKHIALRVGFVGALLFLTITGVAGATIFVHNHAPQLAGGSGWNETISWLGENTSENAKLFNWWSEGHWITFLAERRVATDNTNGDGQALKDVPMFFLDENIDHAVGILKAYDSDYVLVDLDTLQSLPLFGMYLYDTANQNDPRIAKYFAVYMGCTKTEFQLQKENYYMCGSNKMMEDYMSSIPTSWTNKPFTIVNGKTPLFYYTDNGKGVLYAFSYPSNNTMAVKMWLFNPEVSKYLTLVYAKNTVRVYKVNKDALKTVEPVMYGMTKDEVDAWNSKVKAYYGDNW